LKNTNKLGAEVVINPEIVIGLVGPIGVQLEDVQDSIFDELKALNYRYEFIKVTELMQRWDVGEEKISKASFYDYYKGLIRYADGFRKHCESHSALAALAIEEIRSMRSEYHKRKKLDFDRLSDDKQHELEAKYRDQPVLGTAYIIRQFKLPQEIELLRRTYGRKFIQVSVFLDKFERKKSLVKSIKKFNSTRVTTSSAAQQSIQLMEIDSNEDNEEYGQRISNVFHLGDVFLQGNRKENIEKTTKRFFKALFGSNAISPSKMEYGMYAAAGAALRSIDLSRQVGAAIFSDEGEIKALGCNEVPRAFGGTYWEDHDGGPHRDFEEGLDANHTRKVEILHDFLTRLKKIKSEGYPPSAETVGKEVEDLLKNDQIQGSQLMDIIEFGRMVHAEMSAITDAARLGTSIKNTILYCTTFPCHMCAKHIVASGIRRVVFLEPYPKSYAEELHSDSITFTHSEAKNKVYFEPFIGISPRRYRDIFEKKKRKGEDGKTRVWYEGFPESKSAPLIEDRSSSYIENEIAAIQAGGLGKLKGKER